MLLAAAHTQHHRRGLAARQPDRPGAARHHRHRRRVRHGVPHDPQRVPQPQDAGAARGAVGGAVFARVRRVLGQLRGRRHLRADHGRVRARGVRRRQGVPLLQPGLAGGRRVRLQPLGERAAGLLPPRRPRLEQARRRRLLHVRLGQQARPRVRVRLHERRERGAGRQRARRAHAVARVRRRGVDHERGGRPARPPPRVAHRALRADAAARAVRAVLRRG
mmetsp:Transcript_27989/g.96734  ORF Transcript_27989/g.96734 Transcript_27989/m.96734 type:complete len:220 (+) Transcript_27989:710-1369(+)